MTEYIEIWPETTDDPDVMRLVTNLDLTGGEPAETYESPEEGEQGSPLAQALFEVPGISALTIEGSVAQVRRTPDVEWHDLVEDVTDILKDFFL
jgi:scaffold Nfu/NifU family protein